MRCWILTCASAYSSSMKIHSSCRCAGQITCGLGNLSTSFSKRKTDFPLWMNWGFRAGATGTGAKKHALIMNRFKLKIVWRFLTIRWMRSNYKMKLEVFVKELHFMLMPYCSRLVLLAKKPFSQQKWVPLLWSHASSVSSPCQDDSKGVSLLL